MRLLTALHRGLGLITSTNMTAHKSSVLTPVPGNLMPPLTSLDSYIHVYTHIHVKYMNRSKIIIAAQLLLAVKTAELGEGEG